MAVHEAKLARAHAPVEHVLAQATGPQQQEQRLVPYIMTSNAQSIIQLPLHPSFNWMSSLLEVSLNAVTRRAV